MAQAARAAGSRFLLTYNQFDSTANIARVAGVTNTTLGLPVLSSNYTRIMAELVDTNGVAAFSAGATAVCANIPALAAASTTLWFKGRCCVDQLRAMAASTTAGFLKVGSGAATANGKIEVYWTTGSGVGAAAQVFLTCATYMTGGVRTGVFNTDTRFLQAALPPSLMTYPTWTGSLVTSGTTGSGASSIVLAATTLSGTIAQGSQFTIGSTLYTASSAATASANTITIAVTPNTPGTISAGTAAAWTPSLGCYVNYAVGYNQAAGTMSLELTDDGGTPLVDASGHTPSGTLSFFPAFTGTLATSGATAGSATSIVLGATTLTGTITIGSTFVIAGVTYTASAAATAAANAITIPVAGTPVGSGGIAASTAAAWGQPAALNTDGGVNGQLLLNNAFNGAAHALAMRHAGLAAYTGAMPAAGSPLLWQPAQATDPGLIAQWNMADATSGALTTIAHTFQGGPSLTVTGTVAGAFDCGSMNNWALWPIGPGGISMDENEWAEFHMIASCTGPTTMTFNYGPDFTVSLARAQGTPSRAYMFEGEGGVQSSYGGFGTSSTTCTQLIQTYVTGVVSRYVAKYGTAAQGGIREWNVCNEFIQGGSLQSSTWSAHLPAWVTVACQAVHAADPTAMIMINLNNIEYASSSAQQAGMLTQVRALIAAGIPPGKILAGHEFHLGNIGNGYLLTDATAFKNYVAQLAGLGVWWNCSECDVIDQALDGGAGNPNTTARLARAALNVIVWQNLFAGCLTNDPTSWSSVWSFGAWQLSCLTSWVNTNALGSSIERVDGDIEMCDLLGLNYERMGGAGSTSDVYGTWMAMFAQHAGASTGVPSTLPPEMPAGMTVVENWGAVTAARITLAGTQASGSFNAGGPVALTWQRNGGNGTFGLAAAAQNPDGSTNADVQPGMRCMFPAGQQNDPAVDISAGHTPGTGNYFISWYERLMPISGGWGNVFSNTGLSGTPVFGNAEDLKIWAPIDTSAGGDNLTICAPLTNGANPVFGLNFQGGVDGKNIPDNNQVGGAGTTPVTSAFYWPNPGTWARYSVLVQSAGTANSATSTVSLWINGAFCGSATDVTDASAWPTSHMYCARSAETGTQTTKAYKDVDQVVIAVS